MKFTRILEKLPSPKWGNTSKLIFAFCPVLRFTISIARLLTKVILLT